MFNPFSVSGGTIIIGIVYAKTVEWFLKLCEKIVKKILDKRIDKLVGWLDRKILSVPRHIKKYIKEKSLLFVRLIAQGVILFFAVYFAFSIVISKNLTLRQSVILSQAVISYNADSKTHKPFLNKEAEAFLIKNAQLIMSLPANTNAPVVLMTQQNLVGLGLLKDGPIEQGEATLLLPNNNKQTGNFVYYHTDITSFGKLVAFWRFKDLSLKNIILGMKSRIFHK